MRKEIFYLCGIIIAAVGTECPEPSKAHSTNCALFYNCVNLPDGGYVWVPSKCADGLAYQPYLRLCVLPGDHWTCSSSSTDSSFTTSRYDDGQFKNQVENGYLDSTPNTLDFSEVIDQSFTIEGGTITPYPLFGIERTTESENIKAENESENQFSYQKNKQTSMETYSLLTRLINHLLIYKQITIPLETLALSSVPTPTGTELPNLTTPMESIKNTQHNFLTNYLIQNYIQQNSLQTTVIANINPESTTGAGNGGLVNTINNMTVHLNIEATGSTLSNADGEKNIVLIRDNAGNRQYMTVMNYKLQEQYLNSQYSVLLPCIRNIRLANTTDCTKYYTCDPRTATVVEYSCPQNTTFNLHNRICDKEVDIYSKSTMGCTLQSNETITQNTKPTLQKICSELGKMKDPSSDYHYFICYSASPSSTDFKSLRLACPNDLIFCQSKKFCTTRKLCTS